MPTLIITRGLQGSGKTTRAKAWVAEDLTHRARVNRDDIRAQLHDGEWRGPDTEPQVIAVRDAAIRALLRKGVDVVCDDTNLPSRTARDLRRIAVLAGAEFEVWDLTDVPVDECVRRDAARDRVVGEQVIRDAYQRYLAGKPHPLTLPGEVEDVATAVRPYVVVPGTPKAVMVDVDGTVALMAGRSPYDETRVHEDRPNQQVIDIVQELAATHRIVFCSGRTDACREATEKWLAGNVFASYDALHMRKVGDMRKDSVVKREIFDEHIRGRYDVVAVLDDRNQVVEMWRSLGLTVLQVADGNF
jgi:predicted kinase